MKSKIAPEPFVTSKGRKSSNQNEIVWKGDGFVPFYLFIKPTHQHVTITRGAVKIEETKTSWMSSTVETKNVDTSDLSQITIDKVRSLLDSKTRCDGY